MGNMVGTEYSPEHSDILPADSRDSGHVIVCGLGRFGLRIVELLRERDIPVVIISLDSREDRKNRAFFLGARIVTGDFRFPQSLFIKSLIFLIVVP
ncbi:MAG: hypothetical protein OHK0029_40770 [Armatimonadaceae bacterium]